MSEIRYEISATGGEETAETFEDLRAKQIAASGEAKRLAEELRKIKASGQVSAQGVQSLTQELARAQIEQEKFARKAREAAAAAEQMSGATRKFNGGANEMINMISEATLGLGTISPQMREFAIAFATAGNNVAQLGRALPGPVGIIVGLGMTAIPVLIAKIVEWSRETDKASQANERLSRSARGAAQATRDLVAAMRSRAAADRMATIGQEGNQATSEEIGQVIDQTRAMRDVAERDLRQMRASIREADRLRTTATGREAEAAVNLMRRRESAARDLEGVVSRLRAEEERLTDAQSRRVAGELAEGVSADTAEQEAEALAADETRSRRRGRRHQSELEQRLEREEAFFRDLQRLRDRDLEHEMQTRQRINADIRREDERMRREAEQQRREAERVARAMERQRQRDERDAFRKLEETERRAQESFNKTKDQAESIVGPAVQELTGAISEVIAGSKSADEAFQGLLASFLEMLAQRAALEAAGQFAAAIASFASQDYGGGALHLAAGAAWTAVAVASGAASIAVAPPAAATPASPQQSAPAASQRGGDTIVNLNGAVVTAGTRAELGREIGTLIEAGGRRFGRG